MTSLQRRLAIAAGIALVAAMAAPLSAEQLPSDSRVLSGKFENGASWMYRKHDNPPGRMAIIIHVRTGSLNETDQQRGLAHFMEHMAFNGTENIPPGELLPYFESIGMEFGSDVNAFTSFDQTSYMLFLPDTKLETIDKALMVMSDYVYRALLLEDEINKERGVVLEESRRGKSADQRMRDKLWPELFENTRFAKRMVIGDDEILANAPRSEFVDYYKTWYRPENVTALLVGDADAEPIIPLIQKWIGEFQRAEPARAPHGPEFKPFTKQRAIVVTDPEAVGADVTMTNIYPGRPPTTTVEQWRVELVEEIGSWIVDRRYDQRVNSGEASYRRASASVGDFFHDAIMVDGSASGEPGDWAMILEELIVEVNRAREYGFSERELELARKELLASAQRAVRTESTQSARGMLFRMLGSVNDRTPLLSAQQQLDLYTTLLPDVRLEEVDAAFREHFKPGTFAYVLEMPEKEGVDVPDRDQLLSTALESWDRKVEPLHEDETPTELLASLPTPGKVVESVVDKDLGITSAWLDNGVRVHHRYMDYKEDTVMVSVSLAGGGIEETAANSGVTTVASLAFNEAATHRLNSTEIRDIMTGKNIRVGASRRGASQSSDTVMLSIQGSPQDLEAGLQLANALLTDGMIEEAAFKNWKLQTLQRLERMKTMPQFRLMEAMTDMLSGGDPRMVMMNEDTVNRQSIEEAQAWFDRLCREAPIEVAVVGDITADKAMPLVAQYLGSLPERARSAKSLDALRKVARPDGPLERHIKVETITPQGMAMAGFLAADAKNTDERRCFELASEILSSRLVKRVREELGLVYSIGARYQGSWVYEDSSPFMAGAPCDPANVGRVIEEVHTIFADFASNGPTEEELHNAKKQIATNLDTDMKEPRYWWSILTNYDLHGRSLDDEKAERAAFDELTAEQVQGVFKRFYVPTRKFSATAVPVGPESEEAQTAAEQPVMARP